MFTKENFELVLDTLKNTPLGVYKICVKNNFRPEDFYNYMRKNDGEQERYARAKEIQCEIIADDLLNIADDGINDTIVKVNEKTGEEYEIENREWLNRSRLRVDTRKWLLSKLVPKKYGDRVDVEHGGTINVISHIPDEVQP
jgi:hypothetical protein